MNLDFEAGQREHERLAAKPQRRYERRDLILGAAISDGFDDRGKRVSAATLRLVLLAINSFGDTCHAATATIGKRCGDAAWQTLIPRPQALSSRTVKSAIQALYRRSPELLDRTGKGKRHEQRRILWQYLKPAMGELVPRMGELVPPMGELGSPQLQEKNCSKGTATHDDDGLLSLKEKANRFAKIVPCRKRELRERVLRICKLWELKRLPDAVCEDVLRELSHLKATIGIKKPRSLLFTLFRNRGYDLDTMIVAVPESLVNPPVTKGTADDGHTEQVENQVRGNELGRSVLCRRETQDDPPAAVDSR